MRSRREPRGSSIPPSVKIATSFSRDAYTSSTARQGAGLGNSSAVSAARSLGHTEAGALQELSELPGVDVRQRDGDLDVTGLIHDALTPPRCRGGRHRPESRGAGRVGRTRTSERAQGLRNSPLGHNQIRPGERVFVIAPLAAKPRPENAHRYGGIASGATYVDSDPISTADPLGLWVKRCSRTLGKTHAPVKPWSFRDILALKHDYLDVSGQTIGFFPLNGGVMGAGSVQYGGENPGSASCSTICGDDAFDKYVTAAADKIGAPSYCLLAIKGSLPNLIGLHNCQTWTDDVLKEAKQQYLAHEHCRKCFR